MRPRNVETLFFGLAGAFFIILGVAAVAFHLEYDTWAAMMWVAAVTMLGTQVSMLALDFYDHDGWGRAWY